MFVRDIPNRLPLACCYLCLCPVQYLLELADAMSHARVHVSLRALDVIMKIIAEILDVADGRLRNCGLLEVTGE